MLVVASSRKSFVYFIMCVTTGEQGRMKIIGLLPLEKFYKFWTTAQLEQSGEARAREREKTGHDKTSLAYGEHNLMLKISHN